MHESKNFDRMKKTLLFVTLGFFIASFVFNGGASYQLAVLKYSGGGDYYANPTALPNLIKFCNSKNMWSQNICLEN